MLHSMSVYLSNKKASFDYELLDKYEAGIELVGSEVKSIRTKKGSLDGARVVVRGGEAFLLGASISPYQVKNTPDSYERDRPRKLLLNKKELNALLGAESTKGLTVVPISMYSKGRHIKVSIAVVRGKKKYDKRAVIRERDTRRDVEREVKTRLR